MARIQIWGDGAVKDNGKPEAIAGWGTIIVVDERIVREFNGQLLPPKYPPYQSNNTGELTAIIEGLRALEGRAYELEVISDSAYVINGMIQEWWKKWEKNGWKNSNGEPVANKRLWKELIRLSQPHSIVWRHVKGHQGIDLNERCDELAKMGVRGDIVDIMTIPLQTVLSDIPEYMPVVQDYDEEEELDF